MICLVGCFVVVYLVGLCLFSVVGWLVGWFVFVCFLWLVGAAELMVTQIPMVTTLD